MKDKLVKILARKVVAIKTCNDEWKEKHTEAIEKLQENYLPSGSGFDAGSTVDIDRSDGNRLYIEFAYHHMDEGYYIGWSYHTAIVIGSLHGFTVHIHSKNAEGEVIANDFDRDYFAETFHQALSQAVEEKE